MGGADHQHTKTALTDTAAHGEGQLTGEQHLVEGELPAVVAAGDGELVVEGLGADADAHGGDLKRAAQDVVPEQQIAVERPVVVVGRAAVVLDAGVQGKTDLHQEDGAVLTADGILALLGGEVGVLVLQLLRGDEEHVAGELGVQAREGDAERVVRLDDGADNVTHRALEVGDVAVAGVDDLFPVPLIDVDGVEVVHLFVAADGVHIGEQALADIELVALERQTLPLGEALHDLRVVADVGDIEADGALHAVEVIVQTGIFFHEEGSGNAAQIERVAQVDLKITLDEFNGALHLVNVQRRVIVGGNVGLAHCRFTPSKCLYV